MAEEFEANKMLYSWQGLRNAQPRKIDGLDDLDVYKISISCERFALLTSTGQLYMCENNDKDLLLSQSGEPASSSRMVQPLHGMLN